MGLTAWIARRYPQVYQAGVGAGVLVVIWGVSNLVIDMAGFFLHLNPRTAAKCVRVALPLRDARRSCDAGPAVAWSSCRVSTLSSSSA